MTPERFNAIQLDYGLHIAILATQLHAIQMTMKIHKVDRTRILKKFSKLTWEVSAETTDLAIKVWDVLYDWEISQSLDGVGGCEKKTIKELVERQDAERLAESID